MDLPRIEDIQRLHEQEIQAELDDLAGRKAVRAQIEAAEVLGRIESSLGPVSGDLAEIQAAMNAMREHLVALAVLSDRTAEAARQLRWIKWGVFLLLAAAVLR